MKVIRLLAMAVIGCLVLGCSAAASSPSIQVSTSPSAQVTAAPSTQVTTSPAAAPSPTDEAVAGIVAIGHSGLTGEGTGDTYGPDPENSWATGTNPDVDSVYLRMVASHPETKDRVANTARGGAVALELPGMATSALQAVHHPALVIISTIDNDILCDGTDPKHVPELGASVAAALQIITDASPDSKVLVVGQLGRPRVAYLNELITKHPEFKTAMSGDGMCDLLGTDGKPSAEHLKALTAIIESYEAEEARVCAAVPNCRTDGGVRAAYLDTVENFSPDFNHLNIRGQAAEAELIWPVVTKTLGW